MRRSADRGISIVMVALLLVPLLLFSGLAVDLGGWYARAAAIQRAADAAALAGVAQLANGESAAVAEATRVAALNGFRDGVDGVTVRAERVSGTPRILVEITDTDVDRYLTAPFRDEVTIRRRATAEHVPVVPMGSPFNFIGTNDQDHITGFRENFWLTVSGYCAYHEHGDRITPRGDAQDANPGPGVTFAGCEPGVNGVRANADFVGRYFFGITFPVSAVNQQLEMFDAPNCQGTLGHATGDEGGSAASQKDYRIRVRAPGPDPAGADVLFEDTLTRDDCTTMRDQWVKVFDFPPVDAGDTYYLEVEPVVPVDLAGDNSQEGQNRFALRVAESGGFRPCSNANGEPGYDGTTGCNANIFALTHLGVQATFASDATYYLADIGPEHNGKTMTVELFDVGDGADQVELVPPTGDPDNESPIPVVWEVACMDGSYRSENGDNCRTNTGETAPSGGYGPFVDSTVDVSEIGSSPQPWGTRNSQNGLYNDRTIRLRLELPDNIEDAYGGRTWWRIRVITDVSINDRTTWSVFVEGDPVRLVPNS